MSIPKHRLELPPEAEPARDFIEALVARYESQIEELKQQVQSLSEQVQSLSFPGTVPGYVCVLLRDSPCRKPGDSPQVCMRVLLWICLLNATSSRSQVKLARLPYE